MVIQFEVSFITREGERKSGPLATLWRLIESYEVDIFEVSLSRITEDFLNYMATAHIPLAEQTDFVLMAAKLIYYKSKMLLPTSSYDLEDEPVDVLPKELVEQLLEYKRYQKAAELLRELEQKTNLALFREPSWGQYEKDLDFLRVDLISFLKAFREFLERKEKEKPLFFEEESVTTEEMMDFLRERLFLYPEISFFRLCQNFSLMKAIVLFLAILELIRLREIQIEQKEAMADFIIRRYA